MSEHPVLFSLGAYAGTFAVAMLVALFVKFTYAVIHRG